MELYALVPDRIRRVRLRRRRLVGVLSRNDFTLCAVSGAHEQQILRISRNPSDPADNLSSALNGIKRRGQSVTLRLCQELGLRRLLTIPLAARDDLDHLLRFEMDRLSPFGSDSVCFAHRVVDVDQGRRVVLVEIEIAPCSIVDRAIAIARRLDLEPRGLELAGGTSDTRLNLLPRQASKSSSMSPLDRTLAGLALASVAAGVVLPLHKQYVAAAHLERKTVAARRHAEKSLELQQQIDALTSTVNFVLGHKRPAVMMTRVLAELAHVIPDQAYVVRLDVNEREVRIDGYAQSVSDLISSLERSTLFWKTEFLSPIVPDSQNGGQRFRIAVEIRPMDG